MGDFDVSATTSDPGNELTPRLCGCGCGRQSTKASGYRWSYWCDPAVSDAEKLASRQLGGRRGQMTPAEASRLFDQLDPNSPESRASFRLRLMELLSVGRLTGSMYRDLLAGLDGMWKDAERAKAGQKAPAPIIQVVDGLRGYGAEPVGNALEAEPEP